ncbi:MAG: class I SAM-dependent methyltransferase [Candidatus Melainabacteria bacterium]
MSETMHALIQRQWDDVFQKRAWGQYPPEYLIRQVARHFYNVPDRARIKFLDLGAGTGTSSWFLLREGFSEVTALDCSDTALELAKQRMTGEGYVLRTSVGAMESLPFEDGVFDCVVDTGGTTSNPLATCQRIVREIHRVLKPGGKYFAMYLGQETTVTGTGPEPHFYTEATAGPLAGTPTFRLFNRAELEKLLSGFTDVFIEKETRTQNRQTEVSQIWVVTATRP